MMQCLVAYTVCAMFMIKLPYQFVDRQLAAKHFRIFLIITIRIYFSVDAMSEIYCNMELVGYGKLPSIPFLKSSIPFQFHPGIFHIP